jgi:Protein of unknown function (DUF3096)
MPEAPRIYRAGKRLGKLVTCKSGSCRRRAPEPNFTHPLLPLVSLAAGVFPLIAPRIVNVAVAVYLIVTGLLGLNGIYHFFK